MEFRQLLPDAGPVDVSALLRSMKPGARAGEERPYVLANFIASADGRAAFQGRSGALGDPADRFLFHGLREQVDAVFAGTRTLQIERYGRTMRDAEGRHRREQQGLSPEPLACVVTRSGDIPTEIPLFAEPESRIALFSAAPIDLSGCAARIELVQLDPGELTLTTVLRRLRADFGITSLLCEGGPTVFASLLQEHLVDELFLTLAAKLVGGGSAPTITSGTELKELQQMQVAWALEHDGALYMRYRLS